MRHKNAMHKNPLLVKVESSNCQISTMHNRKHYHRKD